MNENEELIAILASIVLSTKRNSRPDKVRGSIHNS